MLKIPLKLVSFNFKMFSTLDVLQCIELYCSSIFFFLLKWISPLNTLNIKDVDSQNKRKSCHNLHDIIINYNLQKNTQKICRTASKQNNDRIMIYELLQSSYKNRCCCYRRVHEKC